MVNFLLNSSNFPFMLCSVLYTCSHFTALLHLILVVFCVFLAFRLYYWKRTVAYYWPFTRESKSHTFFFFARSEKGATKYVSELITEELKPNLRTFRIYVLLKSVILCDTVCLLFLFCSQQ